MPRLSAREERPLALALRAAALAARKQEGLTQAEVARRVGVKLEVYGRIERGEVFPSVPLLRRLCVTLKIPSDALLGLEGVAEAAPKPGDSPGLKRLMLAAEGLSDPQLRLLQRLAVFMRTDAETPRRPRKKRKAEPDARSA
jgi:transcriptional regulator with XRE-family HTH domain